MNRVPVSDASTSEHDRDRAEQQRRQAERRERENRYLLELAEAEAATKEAA